MLFTEPVFLFCFLPVLLLAYAIVRSIGGVVAGNTLLLVFSLLFYAWGEQVFVSLMLFSIAANAGFGFAVDRNRGRRGAEWFVAGALIFNLLLLGYFKYANFFVDNFNEFVGLLGIQPTHLASVHLPIGISFFTFQAMSYVIDVHRGHARAQKNPLNVGLYISLFPQLIAGPIVRYQQIAEQLRDRVLSVSQFSEGVRRFVIGLGKKMLIANTLALPADHIFGLPPGELTLTLAWLGCLCYALQIYFDFSGYSDMAIGLGHMFGFTFPENFRHPYCAASIREFWQRWHITLSTWFRDYLYIPLGGNRLGPVRTYFNLCVVFLLCGFWHGASWTFILWGLFHGLLLVVERLGFGRALGRIWHPLRHLYVLVAVLIAWVLFRADSVSHAGSILVALVGGNGLTSTLHPIICIENAEVYLALVLGVVGSMPAFDHVSHWMRAMMVRSSSLRPSGRPGPAMAMAVYGADTVFLGLVFFFSAMSIASNSYNPFIYFRF